MRGFRSLPHVLLLLALAANLGPVRGMSAQGGASPPVPQVEIVPRKWLVLAPVDDRGRRPFRPDAVLARYVLDGSGTAPQAGEAVRGERGEEQWEERTPGDDGRVGGGRIGYAYTEVESDVEVVVLAQLNGAATLLIDGVPYAGDYYNYGGGGVPVKLARGINHVFVTGIRGAFRLQFREPASPIVLGTWDCTIPDLIRGEQRDVEAGILVMNASLEAREVFPLVMGPLGPWREDNLLWQSAVKLGPLEVRKIGVTIEWEIGEGIAEDAGSVDVSMGFQDSEHVFQVPLRDPAALQRRTFRSRVDDSVQEYCVKPPGDEGDVTAPMRLLLSVHGAGVQAWGQAACYPAYSDFWHVAATNRRPFGFDWQDWGRLDAYEVLDQALELSGVDRRYVHLGGHSMGGHGVWHLGANDPDGFASLAPSAGWRSFDTYGSRPEGELRWLWHAADAPSNTEALVNNLLHTPTYILHSDQDDNVPVEEAYAMRDLLTAKGAPPRMHVEPGQGHWWDAGIGPGTDCLAWPGFYEMFRESAIPRAPRDIDFTSVDPVVDAEHFWVRVDQPLVYGQALRVQGTWTPEARRIEITTENVARLRVTAPGWNGIETVVLDGIEHGVVREEGAWWFVHDGAAWGPGTERPADEKRPDRSGPLKRAFDNRFLLVVPTAGNALENARARERARYHAAVWQYRGNGDAPIVTDREVQTAGLWHHNLILFGNRDTNRAWATCVPDDCPVVVERGAVTVGEQRFEGDDLGALFVQPRKHDEHSLVGVFATTGPRAELLSTTLAPFVSGVGYPDYAVYDATVLTTGDGGVRAAGWFDATWQLQAAGSFRR